MMSDEEAARYRRATHLALDQLQWCVGYFSTIRKSEISQQVAKNRTAILRRVREIEDDASHHH